MNPVSFALPAMPSDIVNAILRQLDGDPAVPVLLSASRWSQASPACQQQLQVWRRVNADPDHVLCQRLTPAMAYGEPLLRPWLVARPFMNALAPSGVVDRINEHITKLSLDPRCAALLVLACERRQLGPELAVIVADYLRRQNVIVAADPGESAGGPAGRDAALSSEHPLMMADSEACKVAALLVLNASDFIIAGKYDAEAAVHAVVRALVEMPLEARVIGLSALVGIHTSIDQDLFMEALQPRLSLLLPPHWDPAFMQTELGNILLAALREMSLKRFPSIAAVALPAMRFLGKWLDQLPQESRHASVIEHTAHHVLVMLTVQSLFWLAKDNAPAKRAFLQEFVARGFITTTEFAVLEQHPSWCLPYAGLCFTKLPRQRTQGATDTEAPDATRPYGCALV